MIELLPAAWLIGMDEPQRWVAQIGARMVPFPPCARAHWGRWRTGLRYLQWYERPGTGEMLTVHLTAHPTRVDVGVWTSAWEGRNTLGYWPYYDLVMTVATTIIDQYNGPDGPPVQVQVQSYTATQSSLD